ncbi:hypothetical protein Tco_0517618 [Tanacetum coccineum]
MLMRSDKLYKFSDGTLTRLLTLLEDITKNIHMEYLPKRRWSSLEKKRAYFMIKAINKLMKERRMMRSLEKFVGFNTIAGNHVKEILLKLNLPDHKSILIDSKIHIKIDMEVFELDIGIDNAAFICLPPEWNTHVVVWINKTEIETMSIDDLYNNFKIVEQKIKKTVGTSSGGQNLAFMTAPSSSSTNDANTAYSQVSAASPSVNTASLQVCTANVSDKPNGFEVAALFAKCESKEVLSEDSVEIKTAPRSKEGFDWSDMAEEQVQTNMALMAFSDSENEVLFSEEVVVLKREVGVKQYEINMLKTEFGQLLGRQITNKSKKGFGYSAVPPPHPLIYNRPKKLDLSYSGLDEFKEPEFKGYGPENNKKESNVVCDKESENSKDNSVKSLVEEQVSQVKSSFVEGCGSNTSKSVSEVEPKKVRKNNDAPIIED